MLCRDRGVDVREVHRLHCHPESRFRVDGLYAEITEVDGGIGRGAPRIRGVRGGTHACWHLDAHTLADGVLERNAVPLFVFNQGADCIGLWRTTGAPVLPPAGRFSAALRTTTCSAAATSAPDGGRLALDSLSRTHLASS